jgi:maleylacetoacetate isomerase/maleylpyruvate isomerase
MAITLYSYWRSTAAYRVRIALNVKGIEHRIVPVNLVEAEHRASEYRARNPQMLVPFLEDGDTGIAQSQAIIEYLDERYGEPRLFPGDPAARARVRAFAAAIGCDIHPLNNLRVLKYLKGQLGADEAAVNAWYAHWIHEGFRSLETIASDGPFALGKELTAADVFLVAQMYNARRFDVDVSAFPKLVRVEEYCLQLDAFADAAPERQADAAPAPR